MSNSTENQETGIPFQKKLDDLFALRQIPWMLKIARVEDFAIELKKLKKLQTSIYSLDHLLESEWKIDQDRLNLLWNSILEDLKIFDIEFPDATNWCDEINRYLQHELDLRFNKNPLRFTLKYYYYYKSCDVKLLRKLIYYRYPSLKKTIQENDWILFDLITEIYDDLEDLPEDCKTYNASYFLFSLKFFGRDKTKEIFQTFLDEIERDIASKREEKLSSQNQEIIVMSNANLDEARRLLKSRLEGLNEEMINSALVFTEFTNH